MKIIKNINYVWKILVGLIKVWVVLLIFSSAFGSFESIVFSILILIYVNIASFGGFLNYKFQEHSQALNTEFNLIRKKMMSSDDESKNVPDKIFLGDEPDEYMEYTPEYYSESSNKIELAEKISKRGLFIDSFFLIIISIIATWNLILTLLSV